MPDSTAQSPATRRPRPDPGRVEDLVREHWGLPVTATHPLPSHKDFNTRIDTPEGPAAVLKIYAPDESPDVIDLELAVLERLAARAPDLPVPRPLPTLDGQLTLRVDLPGQGAHRARLLSWLPGEPLAGARPRGVDPAEALGRLLGRLDAALADFDHPGAHRESFVWELSQAPGILREGAERVTRPGGRGLVERALADFETYVAPRADDLPRQVVHNDANDHNVLLAPPDASPRPVVGLLDFGDCTHTWRVAEVAIAAAYAALGESRPERIVATLAAAYHGQQPLTDAELAVLHTLVRARLAVSVCLSAAARAEEPDEPYLTVSEAPAWEALERLGAIHDRFAEGLYRHACGRPPPPAWVAVASWLGEHAAAGASPLDGAADPSAMLVLDLSVDSPDVDDLDALADARGWTRRIERQLDEAGARAGVGRYDEVRLCYTSPSFATGEDDGERRTVHLGVDLFAPAGTPVRAPLDGRVVWRADNARPLDYGPTVLLEHGPPGGPRFFTLYGHLSRDSLAGLRARQTVRRGEAFAALGDVSENGGWPPHLHFQVLADHLDATGDFPGVAAPSERQVWLALCPDPALLIPLPPGSRAPRAPGVDELMRARRARIAPALSVSYRKPLHIVRGWRQHLYDADGQAYLDGVNNVCHVGHAHPRVVAAARRQMGVLNTNTRYLHPALLTYAERLAATLPDPLEVCFFVNSGSEANELALRLAFTATGRSDVVVLEGAYHGNTGRAVEISPYKFDGPGGRGAPPWVHVAPMPDPFRGACADEPDPGAAYAAALGDVVRAAADAGRPVAAFIHESILSCGGQIVPPAGFLPR
ncbi:MAG: aminotransferase class III-fold pyridoxal phosphate-dependent enzyme, partial [Gemmatimonadetes bacterium]